ncbi:hypothetical protein YB2330_005976 [Saitoella coloradoensis]
MSTGPPRDLIGYGSSPPDFTWPNNANLCLSFVLNYEEGGENTLLNGDPGSETYLTEIGVSPSNISVPRRRRDVESGYEYGARCGFWRILSLFEEFGWGFTCWAVGRAIELNPGVVGAMRAGGHEIASHHYRWIDYSALTEDQEREHVRKHLDAVVAAGAPVPRGWYTGRFSARSWEVVKEVYAERGLEGELLYGSDEYNDDLPYYTPGNGDLVIPYTLDNNDMKFHCVPGFVTSSQFFEYLRDAFDTLYAEGVAGRPKMMSVGLHCRIVGRAGRVAGLRRFMEYVSGKEGVWVAKREEIAKFWRREVPFEG